MSLLSFIKKIIAAFNGGSSSSGLMERALNSELDQVGRTSPFSSHSGHDDLEEMMFHQQAHDHEMLQE